MRDLLTHLSTLAQLLGRPARLAATLGACLALALPACGDDGGGGGAAGTGSSEAAASRSVDNARTIRDAGSEDGAALAAVYALQADFQLMVRKAQAEELQQRQSGLGTAQGALSAGCTATSGGTTTYTDCQEGPTTFNGTVTVNGDAITFTIAGDVDPDAYNGPIASAPGGAGGTVRLESVTFDEDGTLTVTDASIDGTIHANIDVAMVVTLPVVGEQAANDTMDLTATYDQVALDAAGCPTGGTLTVTSSGVTVVATYGPACGDVTID